MRGCRGGQGVRTSPGKSQKAISFVWDTGIVPSREAIGSPWSNCFTRHVRKTHTHTRTHARTHTHTHTHTNVVRATAPTPPPPPTKLSGHAHDVTNNISIIPMITIFPEFQRNLSRLSYKKTVTHSLI